MMRGELRIVLLAGLLWLISSQNVGVISFSLSPIISSLSIEDPLLKSLVGGGANIGMLIGAFTSGFLADRVGRRRIIGAYAAIHSLATFLAGLAPTAETLILFRVATGFGVGGALPIIASLVAEYSSPGYRGRNISLVESFWAVGWLSALILSYFTVFTRGDWRLYMFLAGGLSLLIFLGTILRLPESLRFLKMLGRREDASRLASIYGVPLPEVEERRLSWLESVRLLLSRYRRESIGLWITWFSITMGYYGIFIWLPSMLGSISPEIGEYIAGNRFTYLLVITLAQLPGYFSAVLLVDRVGRRSVLGVYLAATALASFLFASSRTVAELYIYGIVLSFFDLGAWAALYTYTPEQYPTHIRGLGSSWAGFFGRIGGILGATVVPFLGMDWFIVFTLFALIHFIGVLGVFLGREMKGVEMVETVTAYA